MNTPKAGRPSFLSAVERAMLDTAIVHSVPSTHGFKLSDRWTGPIVKRYILREFHTRITVRHAQRILKELKESQ